MWLNLCEFFLLFVLQNGFGMAPPYRDYTRRVCDVVLDGGKVWVAVPVLGVLENVGDGAVLEQQL